jgi:uncharacterized membrane protein YbaN (DUF454 family)
VNGADHGVYAVSNQVRGEGTLLETVKKAILIVAGTICVALGVVGIFIPLLPTTPFLLLAAICYAGSSKKLHHWLHYNRLFGSYIRNYREGRGLTATAKLLSVGSLWITIGFSAIVFVPVLIAQLALIAIAVIVSAHILTRPTYKEPRDAKKRQKDVT